MVTLRQSLIVLASATTALAASSYATLQVRSAGVPAGQYKNVSGIQIYHSYPPNSNTSAKAIIYLSDALGLPQVENRLLADSIASNGYLVLVPDLFNGDPIGLDEIDTLAEIQAWTALHPPSITDPIIETTLQYARNELGVERIGAVGYCFGGKYVGRWLDGRDGGVDVGFVAHPSLLLDTEIQTIARPFSIAAGTLDATFNSTDKARAESILNSNNVTFQSTLYSQAPHGFAVRVNESIPQEAYAKQASFVQAVTWFDAWL